MDKGDVYFCPDFKFKDNNTGNKLIIIVNTPDKKEGVLYCKMTSNGKTRSNDYGCHQQYYVTDLHPFPKKTWIQYDSDSIFNDDYAAVWNYINQNKSWELKGNYKQINDIVECMIKSDFIIPKYIRMLAGN